MYESYSHKEMFDPLVYGQINYPLIRFFIHLLKKRNTGEDEEMKRTLTKIITSISGTLGIVLMGTYFPCHFFIETPPNLESHISIARIGHCY